MSRFILLFLILLFSIATLVSSVQNVNDTNPENWSQTRKCEKIFCLKPNETLVTSDPGSKKYIHNHKESRKAQWCHSRNESERKENEESIKKHCKAMVLHEQNAFYVLSGVLVFLLAFSIITVCLRDLRARSKDLQYQEQKRARIQARIEAHRATKNADSNFHKATPTTADWEVKPWVKLLRSKKTGEDTPAEDVERETGIARPPMNWYKRLFGRNSQAQQDADIERASPGNLDGQGNASSRNRVPVMPPAPNAKGRSSSVNLQSSLTTGLRSRRSSSETGNQSREQQSGTANGQGNAASGGHVPVMPPASDANCLSSGVNLHRNSSTGLHSRRESAQDEYEDVEQQSDASIGERMPVTAEVLRYGLTGSLRRPEDIRTAGT